MKFFIYGIGFFLATLLIQAIVHGISKGKKRKWMIYAGPTAVIGLCVIGIMEQEIAFLAAIVGFVIADEIGRAVGWH